MGPTTSPAFGEALRRLREAAGLTQEQLADQAGLSAKAISALERGERQHPHPSTVTALARALRLTEEARATLLATIPRRETPGQTRPPAASLPALPIAPTSLVGRVAEVATLRSYLSKQVRLLTLTGPGGVGKTRLALEVAAAVAAEYADGVVAVMLAPVQQPGLVLTAIAQTLGVRETAGVTPAKAIQAHIERRHLLLVLDNFEHVIDAAQDIAALLMAVPALQVLVTSRTPLRVRGEQQYPVQPLALPGLNALPTVDDVAGTAAVQLFVERACEVQPDFALIQANAAAIAAICRRLDGLPLALELAAARIKLLAPTALLARLDRVLPLLVDGPRDLPERQQTLRSTIAWSYDLLRPEEQALFRGCALFAGGWSQDAALAIAGVSNDQSADAVLELLASLVDKSLLIADARAAMQAEPRFAMFETIRAFALEQLAANREEEATRRRHAAYYRDVAHQAAPGLKSPDQAVWLNRLSLEHDNLRIAIAWLLACGEATPVIDIGWAIWIFWSIRSHLGEAERWIEQAVELAPAEGGATYTRGLIVHAAILFPQDRLDQAAALLEQATDQARGIDDNELLMVGLSLQGFVAVARGDIALAATTQNEALMLARARHDSWGIAGVLNGLSHVALAQGDVDGALLVLREGESLLRASGDPFTLATNLNIQAMIVQLRGDMAEIRRLCGDSARISLHIGDTWAALYSLAGLAIAAAMDNHPRRAARLFSATEALRGTTALDLTYPALRAVYDQYVAAVRAQLDPDTFHIAWQEGQAMTLPEAMAVALDEMDTS